MRIFYDPVATAGAPPAPVIKPSLQELKDGAGKTPPAPPAAIIPPVAPVPDPAAPPVVIEQVPILGPDGKPLAPVIPITTPVADPAVPDPTAAAEPVELTDEEQTAQFWQTVETQTGRTVKVEYPEGIHPLSPEGVVLREQAVRADAQTEFERGLKNTYPRGYAYIMHLAAGGDDEAFMGKGPAVNLPERTAVETDVAAQTMIYKRDLLSRGLDQENVDMIVEKAIKDNKLKTVALKSYDDIQLAQRNQLTQLEQREQQAMHQETVLLQSFDQNVEKTLTDMRFVVQPEEKIAFNKYLNDFVQIADGKVFIVQPIEQDNIKTQLEALYFAYKKGDLSKIISKQATTITAQRLRTSVDKATKAVPASATPDRVPTKSLSLGQVLKLKGSV